MTKSQFLFMMIVLIGGFGFMVHRLGGLSDDVKRLRLSAPVPSASAPVPSASASAPVFEDGVKVSDKIRVLRGEWRYINSSGRVYALFDDKELYLNQIVEYGRVMALSVRGGVCSNEISGVVTCLLPVVRNFNGATLPPRVSLQAAGGVSAPKNSSEKGG